MLIPLPGDGGKAQAVGQDVKGLDVRRYAYVTTDASADLMFSYCCIKVIGSLTSDWQRDSLVRGLEAGSKAHHPQATTLPRLRQGVKRVDTNMV